MSSDHKEHQPYKVLGEKLKSLRQKLHESVAEVSGAVEIDEAVLQRFEQGRERPSEDVLMLLISHFRMREEEAAALWRLAGYEVPSDDDHDDHHHSHDSGRNEQQSRTMVMIMAVDPRVIYTDGAQITANSSGVVIGFSQGAGTPQAMTTAKVGMSREQAYSLMRTLERTLKASEPKPLPSSESTSKPKSQNQNRREKRSSE